jgi:hypothetical protein
MNSYQIAPPASSGRKYPITGKVDLGPPHIDYSSYETVPSGYVADQDCVVFVVTDLGYGASQRVSVVRSGTTRSLGVYAGGASSGEYGSIAIYLKAGDTLNVVNRVTCWKYNYRSGTHLIPNYSVAGGYGNVPNNQSSYVIYGDVRRGGGDGDITRINGSVLIFKEGAIGSGGTGVGSFPIIGKGQYTTGRATRTYFQLLDFDGTALDPGWRCALASTEYPNFEGYGERDYTFTMENDGVFRWYGNSAQRGCGIWVNGNPVHYEKSADPNNKLWALQMSFPVSEGDQVHIIDKGDYDKHCFFHRWENV